MFFRAFIESLSIHLSVQRSENHDKTTLKRSIEKDGQEWSELNMDKIGRAKQELRFFLIV